jgi:hypothetical protein
MSLTDEQRAALQMLAAPARGEMAQAFVMTTTKPGVGDRRSLWAVLADTPDLAVEIARANDCNVDQIVGALSEETVERRGIQPGQARLL